MASNDIAVLREVGGGDAITNTASTATFDTLEHDVGPGTAFTYSGGVVTFAETQMHRVMVIFGGEYAASGAAGSRLITVTLERNSGSGFGTLSGGTAYGYTSGADGQDTATVSHATLVTLNPSDTLRIRRVTAAGGMTESRVWMMLWRIPNSFYTAKLQGGSATNIGTGFTDHTFTGVGIGGGAYFDTTGLAGIKATIAGRCIAWSTMSFSMRDQLVAQPTDGAIAQCRLKVFDDSAAADTFPLGGQFRGSLPFGEPEDRSMTSLWRANLFDLDVNDVLSVQYRQLQKGTATDEVDLRGNNECTLNIIRLDDLSPVLSWFDVKAAGDDTSISQADLPKSLTWDAENEVGTGFSHSTSTNPSRVTFPTGKVLSFVGADIGRGVGSATADDMAWFMEMRANGVTTMPYARSGSTINYGLTTASSLVNSDISLGFMDVVSGPYFEARLDLHGTGDDTATLFGGDAAFDMRWFGVHLDPALIDPKTDGEGISDSGAVSAGATGAQIIGFRGLASEVSSVQGDPSALVIFRGNSDSSPWAGGAGALRQSIQGRMESGTTESASFIQDVMVALSPATASAVAPSASVGLTLTVSPGVGIATAGAPPVTVATLVVGADPATATAVVPNPTVSLSLTVQPDPAAALAVAPSVSTAIGILVQPDPASASAGVPDAAVSLSSLTVSMTPAVAQGVAVGPEVTGGPITVSVSPAVATAQLGEPLVILAALSPETLEVTLSIEKARDVPLSIDQARLQPMER